MRESFVPQPCDDACALRALPPVVGGYFHSTFDRVLQTRCGLARFSFPLRQAPILPLLIFPWPAVQRLRYQGAPGQVQRVLPEDVPAAR